MKLTQSLIHSAGTGGIGFNFHQLRILGVSWPPPLGWISELSGKEIGDDEWDMVMKLKGKRRGERRYLLENSKFDTRMVQPRKRDLRNMLDELTELVQYVRRNVTIEVAAFGVCQCDVTSGDCPCVYCASVHFNEETTESGLRERHQHATVKP